MDQSIIIAVVVIAVIALVGRILINRYNNRKNIAWVKMGAIGIGVIAFLITFINFNPHRAWQWYEGEAYLIEGTNTNICGRKPAKDIPRFASPNDTVNSNYYALEASAIEHSGYYKLKCSNDLHNMVERTEQETVTNRKAITRKTSLFEVVRTPDENIDKYLPVYVITLRDSGKVIACMEEEDAKIGTLPVGLMMPMSDKINTIVERIDTTHSEIISEYYFNLFNEPRYSSNTFNYTIYRACAAIFVAIIIGIIYNVIIRKSRKSKKVKK